MALDALLRRLVLVGGLALVVGAAGCAGADGQSGAQPDDEDQGQTEEELRGGNALVGISDEDPEAFSSSDPIFGDLKSKMHIKSARFITPYDVMDRESDPVCATWLGCPARSFHDWLDAVSTWEDGQPGVDAYVTVTFIDSPNKVGMVHFKHTIEKLFQAYGGEGTTQQTVLGRTYNLNRVKYWGVANETDLAPSYTRSNPRLAARYFITAYEAAKKYCKGCVLVAGEFGRAPASAYTQHGYIHEYFDEIKSHGIDPAVVSMHAYYDVNYLSTVESRRFLKHAKGMFPNTRVWLTEEGTMLHEPKFDNSGNRPRQIDAAWTFERLAHLRGVDRAYFYHVFAPKQNYADPYQGPGRWDSALLDWNNKPRPAFCVFTNQPESVCDGDLHTSPY